MTTQDESPVGLDQSDEDDDDSSDYFADAETSSCGSCDDDTGWPEMSEKKGRFVYMPQEGLSHQPLSLQQPPPKGHRFLLLPCSEQKFPGLPFTTFMLVVISYSSRSEFIISSRGKRAQCVNCAGS